MVVNLQTTMSWFERGGKKKTCKPKQQEDLSVKECFCSDCEQSDVIKLQFKLLIAKKSRNESLIAQQFFTRYLICKVVQTSTAFSSLTHVSPRSVEKPVSLMSVLLVKLVSMNDKARE